MSFQYQRVPTRETAYVSSAIGGASGSSSRSGSFSSSTRSSTDTLVEDRAAPQEQIASQPKSYTQVARLVIVYLLLNLVLTFYNKSLLNGFPYPYLVTALHAGSGVVGCLFLRLCGVQFDRRSSNATASDASLAEQNSQADEKAADIESHVFQSDHKRSSYARPVIVLLYSALYAANIAISNASLRLVSVPFHQIIRSTCPLFTLALSMVVWGRRPQLASIAALIPVVVGAILSCFGEVNYTTLGLVLTILGTLLAALKTVATNVLQGGSSGPRRDNLPSLRTEPQRANCLKQKASAFLRHGAFSYTPLQLLEVMSPLACIQCLLASFSTGELQQAAQGFLSTCSEEATTCQRLDARRGLLLAGNGLVAFLLNYVSFSTNRAAGPLTMTVVANLKQVMTILLAFHFYHLPLALVNQAGIAMALLGTAWYGMLEVQRKQKAR